MNVTLKTVLTIATVVFFAFVAVMVRKKKLELAGTITWFLTAIILIFLAIFDGVVRFFAKLLGIIEPTNALFMAVLCFILLICFQLTIANSKNNKTIRNLTQELALLKKNIESGQKGIDKNENVIYNNTDVEKI